METSKWFTYAHDFLAYKLQIHHTSCLKANYMLVSYIYLIRKLVVDTCVESVLLTVTILHIRMHNVCMITWLSQNFMYLRWIMVTGVHSSGISITFAHLHNYHMQLLIDMVYQIIPLSTQNAWVCLYTSV